MNNKTYTNWSQNKIDKYINVINYLVYMDATSNSPQSLVSDSFSFVLLQLDLWKFGNHET